MGRAVGAARRRALRPLAARARRQQRDDRDADRRPRPGGARRSLFAAVGTAGQRCTIAAPPDRARVDRRRRSSTGSKRPTRSVPIGDPLEPGTLVGPLIDAGGVRRHADGARPARAADGGTVARRRARRWPTRCPDAYYVRPAIVEMPAQTDVVRERDVRADPLRDALPRARRGDRAAQRRAAGPVLVHLHQRPARGRAVPVGRRVATAASPTSTSARAAPRSAARSAARRRPAAAASRARTPGRPTCAGRPTRSTTRPSCRSRRASCSTQDDPQPPARPGRLDHIASPQGRRRHRVDAAGDRDRPGGRSLFRGRRRAGRRVLASRGTDHGRPCRQARERRRIRAAPRPKGAGAAPLRATPVRRHRHGDLRGVSDHRRPACPPPVRIADALDGGSRRRGRAAVGHRRLLPHAGGSSRSAGVDRRGLQPGAGARCTPASAAATSGTLPAERPDEDRGARRVRHGRVGAAPGARPRARGGGGLAATAPRRGRQRHAGWWATSRTRPASTEALAGVDVVCYLVHSLGQARLRRP